MIYDSLEWLYITHRGWAAVVHFEGTYEDYDPAKLLGKMVTVDGHTFKVRGVDRTLQMIYPELPYRGTIGLLE